MPLNTIQWPRCVRSWETFNTSL